MKDIVGFVNNEVFIVRLKFKIVALKLIIILK